MVDRAGIPLAVEVTAANLHNSHMLAPMLDAIPPLKTGRRGRARQRPAKLHADKGYDYRRCWDACVRRGVQYRIARYGRLTIRYERLVAMHRAFLHLGCALICFNYLQRL